MLLAKSNSVICGLFLFFNMIWMGSQLGLDDHKDTVSIVNSPPNAFNQTQNSQTKIFIPYVSKQMVTVIEDLGAPRWQHIPGSC
jgi:hypothetical protein